MNQLTITTRKQGHEAIDRIGDNEAEIKRLQAENRKLRAFVEEWAEEHPDDAFTGVGKRDQTSRYAYSLDKVDPALRVKSHLTVEDVVHRLGASDEGEQYIRKTYDADKIKADFGGSKAKRQMVEEFGLYFTKQGERLCVEQLNAKAA